MRFALLCDRTMMTTSTRASSTEYGHLEKTIMNNFQKHINRHVQTIQMCSYFTVWSRVDNLLGWRSWCQTCRTSRSPTGGSSKNGRATSRCSGSRWRTSRTSTWNSSWTKREWALPTARTDRSWSGINTARIYSSSMKTSSLTTTFSMTSTRWKKGKKNWGTTDNKRTRWRECSSSKWILSIRECRWRCLWVWASLLDRCLSPTNRCSSLDSIWDIKEFQECLNFQKLIMSYNDSHNIYVFNVSDN